MIFKFDFLNISLFCFLFMFLVPLVLFVFLVAFALTVTFVFSFSFFSPLVFFIPLVFFLTVSLLFVFHITVSDSGFITLTESGREIAEMIYERHTLLSSWLERLGVDHETAAADACRMEHVISKESFEAIKKHVKD